MSKPKDEFRWWPVESTIQLRDRLIACKAPRLEEREGGLLRVVETAEDAGPSLTNGEECPDINESRNCPPICP